MIHVFVIAGILVTLSVVVSIRLELEKIQRTITDVHDNTSAVMMQVMKGATAIGHKEGVESERSNVEAQATKSIEITAETVSVKAATIESS